MTQNELGMIVIFVLAIVGVVALLSSASESSSRSHIPNFPLLTDANLENQRKHLVGKISKTKLHKYWGDPRGKLRKQNGEYWFHQNQLDAVVVLYDDQGTIKDVQIREILK